MTIITLKEYSEKIYVLSELIDTKCSKEKILDALRNPCLILPKEFKVFIEEELENRDLVQSKAFLLSVSRQLEKMSEQQNSLEEERYWSNSEGQTSFLFLFNFLNQFLLNKPSDERLIKDFRNISISRDGRSSFNNAKKINLNNKQVFGQRSTLSLSNSDQEFKDKISQYNNSIETVDVYQTDPAKELKGLWIPNLEYDNALIAVNYYGNIRTVKNKFGQSLLNYSISQERYVENAQFTELVLPDSEWYGVEMDESGENQIVYGNTGLCLSKDFGESWKKYDLSVIDKAYISKDGNHIVAIAGADENIVYEYNPSTGEFEIGFEDEEYISVGLSYDGLTQVLGKNNGKISLFIVQQTETGTAYSLHDVINFNNGPVKNIILYETENNELGITLIQENKIYSGIIVFRDNRYYLEVEEVVSYFPYTVFKTSTNVNGQFQLFSYYKDWIYSNNYGKTWTLGKNQYNLSQVVISGDTNILLGSNGSVYISLENEETPIRDNVEIPTSGVSTVSSRWTYLLNDFSNNLSLISSSDDGDVLLGARKDGVYLYKLENVINGPPLLSIDDYFYNISQTEQYSGLKITDIAVSYKSMGVSTTKGAFIYSFQTSEWIDVSNMPELEGANKHFLSCAISQNTNNGIPVLYAFGSTKPKNKYSYMIVAHEGERKIKEYQYAGEYSDIYISIHNNIFASAGEYLLISKNKGKDFTEYGLNKGVIKASLSYDTKNNEDRKVIVLVRFDGKNYIYVYDIKDFINPQFYYLIQDNGKEIIQSKLTSSGNGSIDVLSLIYDDYEIKVLRSDNYGQNWFNQDYGMCYTVIIYSAAAQLFGINNTFYNYNFVSQQGVSSINTVSTNSTNQFQTLFYQNFGANLDLISSAKSGDTVVAASSVDEPYVYVGINLLTNNPTLIKHQYFVLLREQEKYKNLLITSIAVSGKGKCIAVSTTKGAFIYRKMNEDYEWSEVESKKKNKHFLSAAISENDEEGKPSIYAYGSTYNPELIEDSYMLIVSGKDLFIREYSPNVSGNYYDIYVSKHENIFSTTGQYIYISKNSGNNFTGYGLYRGEIKSILSFDGNEQDKGVTVLISNGETNYLSVYNTKDWSNALTNIEIPGTIVKSEITSNSKGNVQILSLIFSDGSVKVLRSDNAGEEWYQIDQGPSKTLIINKNSDYLYGTYENFYRKTTLNSEVSSTKAIPAISSVESEEEQKFSFGGLSFSLNGVNNFEEFEKRIEDEETRVRYFSFCNGPSRQYFELINL